MKYPKMEWGIMEAVVNKLGGMEGVARFLRGELTVTESVCPWRLEDGLICFEVVSDGTTGPQWIELLGDVSPYAKSVLKSPKFKATSGIRYKVAVMPGSLFTDCDRVTHVIRNRAKDKKQFTPPAEVACLIRKTFSNDQIEKMGLRWIVAMHDPIEVSDGYPRLLGADCDNYDFSACYVRPDGKWGQDGGFAFLSEQVS